MPLLVEVSPAMKQALEGLAQENRGTRAAGLGGAEKGAAGDGAAADRSGAGALFAG